MLKRRYPEIRRFWPALFLLVVFSVHATVLTPNPNSLLKSKRVLVIDGSSTSHATTRTAAWAKLQAIQKAVGFTMTHLTGVPSAVTTAYLANFDIVIFNYFFQRDETNISYQAPIKAWLQSGGKGYVGYHTSGANIDGEWQWYRDSVTSILYRLHTGSAQNGSIYSTSDTSITNQTVMQGLPTTWSGIDEWYTYSTGLTWGDTTNLNHNANVKVMYYLNESSLATPLPDAMGVHPAAWYRQDPKGTKYFYSIFTHDPTGITNTDFFQNLVLRVLEWEAGYAPTPVINGNPIHNDGVVYLSSERALQVESKGAYRLNIWSIQGKLLYSAAGQGSKVYRPEALRKPGMYLARVESGDGIFAQKIMIQ